MLWNDTKHIEKKGVKIVKKKKFVIIGSGLFGSVLAERIANDLGSNVTLIDKSSHTGGGCFDAINKETGVEYCVYGPHIFHTDDSKIWDYVTRFTEFNDYIHKVRVFYKGKLYPFPINLLTLSMVYSECTQPSQVNACLSKDRGLNVTRDNNFKALKRANFKDLAMKTVGKRLYNIFYKGYTQKHWGKDPKTLPASLFKRNPVRYDHTDKFYNAKWEGMPVNGYTAMFNNMLSSKRIKIQLDQDARPSIYPVNKDTVIIYTGKLDRLFNYKYGELEWRSLEFKHAIKSIQSYQGISVVNYTDVKVPYIRIVEHKHFHPERPSSPSTMITYEYPVTNNKKPYYPINTLYNNLLYNRYKKEANKIKNLYYGGRLADYKYYNMDQTIGAALTLYERIKKEVA